MRIQKKNGEKKEKIEIRIKRDFNYMMHVDLFYIFVIAFQLKIANEREKNKSYADRHLTIPFTVIIV